MERIRFEHKTLADGRFHVITSPDLKGLHISATTREKAEQEALAMVSLILSQNEDGKRGHLSAVEYQAA